MNCEEYREAIAADPSFDGGAGHLSECAACQGYRKEMQALDETISRALRLDVPELHIPDLDDVQTDNVVALNSRRVSPPAWLAIAATVLVAAMLGVRFAGNQSGSFDLAGEVLAHVQLGEQYALQFSDVPVSDETLESVVPASIARMDHEGGLISYATTCLINGREIPHLVIQGKSGPVTILLMPEETIAEAIELNGERLRGVIIPVGKGSVAILGERDEPLKLIEQKILNSVTWST